jgi:hypothetical protein
MPTELDPWFVPPAQKEAWLDYLKRCSGEVEWAQVWVHKRLPGQVFLRKSAMFEALEASEVAKEPK